MISEHLPFNDTKSSIMAAIVENAENGQMVTDHAYLQSSKSDGIQSLECVSDSSLTLSKVVDLGQGSKVNGLSCVNETLQRQKTDANTQGPWDAKIDSQESLVNSGVIKTETDLMETSEPKESLAGEVHPELKCNESKLDTNPSSPVRFTLCVQVVEEKVKPQVPFDPKSDSSSSLENVGSKPLPCNAKEVKDSLVSLQTSKKESQDTIKSETKESQITDKKRNNKETVLISADKSSTITSTLEDKDLQSNFNDKKLCKTEETISVNINNMDNVNLPEEKMSSKSEPDSNVKPESNSAKIIEKAEEKHPDKNNSMNCTENLKSQTLIGFLPACPADKKDSGASNIPELLAHCSPCRVVIQDFFKELNIDLLELSRNFPVQHAHKRKRLSKSKSAPGESHDGEQIKNHSLNGTKQAKCYTENSKRRKKHPSKEDLNKIAEAEDKEENLPLISIRNNINQNGNAAEDTTKLKSGKGKSSGSCESKMIVDEECTPTKGGNSDEVTTAKSPVKNSTSSNVSMTTTSINSDPADPLPKISAINDSPTVDLSNSNDLGLKIVSVSSQGSVFFPTFISNENSEKIVFTPAETASKLNGQFVESTHKHSAPKCKFHGTDSSPGQHLYKCKKCGLEAKNLSDIQAHMDGSHSEFCMYRCPFCVPSLKVKRVGLYRSRPIEFEVLQESSHKLVAAKPSSVTSTKQKIPRNVRIQREKKRKLNYYYRNQREIKKYKNEKVRCEYCHKEINQSNISRHQNSKICPNSAKAREENLCILPKKKIPKKYQKIRCDSCCKHISRTNMSKHSRICPKENA